MQLDHYLLDDGFTPAIYIYMYAAYWQKMT
jgi:hypothetical protein